MRRVSFLVVALLATTGFILGAESSPFSGTQLRIGLYSLPPFIMDAPDGGHTGYALDLWRSAADDSLGTNSRYIAYPSLADLFTALDRDTIDIAVSSISVTHERAKRMRFSFPWYDAGLRVMVKKTEKPSLWSELEKSRHLWVYFGFFLVLTFLALPMTWIRKKRDPDFPDDMVTGYTQSLLAITSSVRSGETEQEYLGWVGHALSSIWMVCGLAMVAYVTSTMTTAMTTVKLDKNGIYGISDLPGRKVGVLRGGVVQAYLKEMKMNVVPFEKLSSAVARLQAGKLHAIVTDAPALEYWVAQHPDDGLEVVGDIFHPDKYAFAANPRHSVLIDRINVELIRLGEEGAQDALRALYFGE